VKYLLIALTVFGVNLLPAFGPPTWAILVFARLRWHLDAFALVALGVIGATTGRYLLARGARHFKKRMPTRLGDNLEYARRALERRRARTLALFGIFVLSPLPSAQLFLAAGFLKTPLLPLTLAFSLGRVVSYSLYVSAATVADQRFGAVVHNAFGSLWSIIGQALLLAIVCALPFINWRRESH
jgi:membrane protein YqaA with SNARE-associated domain